MSGKIITVSNATQLKAALKLVKGGETILLASGDYGSYSISGINPKTVVTLKSANPDADASFRTLGVTNSSNLVISDIDISRTLRAGEASNTSSFMINKSKDITVVGVDISGSRDGNAHNDGHGLLLINSNRVAILDSTFQQLRAAAVVSGDTDILFAGNTITEVRQGVNISNLRGAVFEQNFVTNMQPAYQWGDHPDAFQVQSTNGGPSSDLMFRDNVLIEGSSGPVGGIFIRNEGSIGRHQDISIENNFYQGTYRHGISVAGVNGLVIDNNTLLDSAKPGNSAAILVTDVNGARVTDNVAPLYMIDNVRSLNSRNNIDVWDPKQKVGVAAANMFASDVAGGNATLASNLDVLAGSVPALRGAGFQKVAAVGDLGSTADAAAIVEAWLPVLNDANHASHYLL